MIRRVRLPRQSVRLASGADGLAKSRNLGAEALYLSLLDLLVTSGGQFLDLLVNALDLLSQRLDRLPIVVVCFKALRKLGSLFGQLLELRELQVLTTELRIRDFMLNT